MYPIRGLLFPTMIKGPGDITFITQSQPQYHQVSPQLMVILWWEHLIIYQRIWMNYDYQWTQSQVVVVVDHCHLWEYSGYEVLCDGYVIGIKAGFNNKYEWVNQHNYGNINHKW